MEEDVDEYKKMVEVDEDKKLLDVDVDVEEAKGRRIWLCAAGLSSLLSCQHLGSGKDEVGAAFIIRLSDYQMARTRMGQHSLSD